ncbi:hypothetical protein [Legionella resiliens]|uniref:Uncharacterized protein n=1 Tax=Legionella resiliens TaxID=2905958 RepID=A0ABS8X5R0_9GAMM|nr:MULTISPECIES: hypothetical protein [unclassified Legionella]MCE0723456.1 hypothetical protein [Legionella sp. 9fVS26]MCE3532610.1 hypothetical protein [Legionella sp. 8cVS16]
MFLLLWSNCSDFLRYDLRIPREWFGAQKSGYPGSSEQNGNRPKIRATALNGNAELNEQIVSL